jgi:hypothetical protein
VLNLWVIESYFGRLRFNRLGNDLTVFGRALPVWSPGLRFGAYSYEGER